MALVGMGTAGGLLLGACQPTGKQAAEQPPAAQAPPTTAAKEPAKEAPKEKITLTVEMSVYVEAPHKKAFDMIEARYEELHPEVDIVLYGPPYAEFWNKLTTEIVAGTEAEIVQLQSGASRYASYAALREGETGAFVNLDPYIKGTWMEDGLTDQRNLTYNGHYIGLANYAWGVGAIYYRKSMFEEAGIVADDIVTSEDWLEAMLKLTKKGEGGKPDQFGYGAVLSSHSFVWSEPAAVIAKPANDGIYFPMEQPPYTPDRIAVNTDAMVWACQWWQDMIKKHQVVPIGNFEKADTRDLFWNKTAAMNTDGPWFLGMTRDRGEEIGEDLVADMDVFASPDVLYNGQSKPRQGSVAGITHLISSQCKYVDQAWEFLAWMASEEGQKLVSVCGMIPCSVEMQASDWYYAEYPLNAKVAGYNSTRYAPPMDSPKIPQLNEMTALLTEAAQEMYIVGRDPKESLDRAAAEMKKILEK
jgi:ABC-type glycerol-3-phosphate transport system substrate-binding protein